MSSLTFKRFDTYPPLTVTLTDQNGPIDLSTASSVHMEMKSSVGTIIPSLAMASFSATSGVIQHTWVGSETSMADTWNLEWEIKWANGGVQTVPNTGIVAITIEQDIEVS